MATTAWLWFCQGADRGWNVPMVHTPTRHNRDHEVSRGIDHEYIEVTQINILLCYFITLLGSFVNVERGKIKVVWDTFQGCQDFKK